MPEGRLQRARAWARRLKNEAYALYLAMLDTRTPWYAKALAFFVVAHTFSPIDLIPDFIPVLGYLDDLLITPLGLWLCLRLIPAPVMADARRQAAGDQQRVDRIGRIGLVMVCTTWLLILTALGVFVWRILAARNQEKGAGGIIQNMALIPAGWFWMGSSTGPPSSRPFHPVYVDAYAIDITEVTVLGYAQFVQATGHIPQAWKSGIPQQKTALPVVGILWREADAYCRWAGKRLPTEAEWERAARGEDGRTFPWGSQWTTHRANIQASQFGGPVPVGSYPQGISPYGLLDMCGNAAEWVADYFDPAYYTYAPQINPQGVRRVLDHGLRGGSWDSPVEQATTFFRDSSHSVLPNLRVGFRCAASITVATEAVP